MKKILFIAILLIIIAACGNDRNKTREYAEEEPLLMVWQTNISKNRLWADNLGLIEIDSVKIRELIKELRTKAKASDTLVVSCLMLVDA
jgi:hypothetical protein